MPKSDDYSSKQRLVDLLNLRRWRQDYTLWAEERLGIDRKTLVWSLNEGYEGHRWDGDKDPFYRVGQLLQRPYARVGIESAVGTGKTFDAAVRLLNFLDCYPDQYDANGNLVEKGGRVITVAPKAEQLRLNLWKEVRRLWPRFKKIRPEAQIMSLRIRMNPDAPEAQDAWGAIGYPVGVGAEEISATKIQGFHDPHMFFIVEETPGVPAAVLEAIAQTCKAPHNVILALGNPDHEHDTLHEWCTRETVDSVRISARDHPNVVLDNHDFILGAVTKQSIADTLLDRKDEQDPLFLSRVRGICPRVSLDALFRASVIDLVTDNLANPEEIIVHEGVSQGLTKIFKKRSDTHLNRYVLFADVGGDSYTGSWHACVVLDRLDYSIAATIHMAGPRDDYANEIVRVANQYIVPYSRQGESLHYYPLLAWETNGVGALHLVPRFAAWPNKYHRRSLERMGGFPRKTLGWATTTDSRETMIQELEMWSLSLLDDPGKLRDEAILEEAKTFVFTPAVRGGGGKYKARPGYRDDLLMAVAGALAVDKLTGSPIRIQHSKHERRRLHYLERKAQRQKDGAGVNYLGQSVVPYNKLPNVP